MTGDEASHVSLTSCSATRRDRVQLVPDREVLGANKVVRVSSIMVRLRWTHQHREFVRTREVAVNWKYPPATDVPNRNKTSCGSTFTSSGRARATGCFGSRAGTSWRPRPTATCGARRASWRCHRTWRPRRSPKRPYDLRHTAVSTWLNSGAPRYAFAVTCADRCTGIPHMFREHPLGAAASGLRLRTPGHGETPAAPGKPLVNGGFSRV